MGSWVESRNPSYCRGVSIGHVATDDGAAITTALASARAIADDRGSSELKGLVP
jgi:hypothetical protein